MPASRGSLTRGIKPMNITCLRKGKKCSVEFVQDNKVVFGFKLSVVELLRLCANWIQTCA